MTLSRRNQPWSKCDELPVMRSVSILSTPGNVALQPVLEPQIAKCVREESNREGIVDDAHMVQLSDCVEGPRDIIEAFGNRWVHLRPSNTEPVVRVIAEALEAEEAERLCRAVGECMKE